MRHLLYLFIFSAILLSCNKDDDTTIEEEEVITELPPQEASFTVQGEATGNFTFVPDDFDAYPSQERIDLDFDQTDLYYMTMTLLSDGGFEEGAVKTLTVSDDMITNEIQFNFDVFTTNHGSFFDSLEGGTVTITDNRPYEIVGGQFSGILLSGNVDFIAEDDDGNQITVTGSFTDVRVLLRG